MQTIKTYGKWQLNKYSKLKHFKNGKANLHMEISYCIEYSDLAENEVATGIFWIKTLKEASIEWSALKRTHSIGGATLRADLFPGKAA